MGETAWKYAVSLLSFCVLLCAGVPVARAETYESLTKQTVAQKMHTGDTEGARQLLAGMDASVQVLDAKSNAESEPGVGKSSKRPAQAAQA